MKAQTHHAHKDYAMLKKGYSHAIRPYDKTSELAT